MKPFPIENHDDYEKAVKWLERVSDDDHDDNAEVISQLIEAYQDKHWPSKPLIRFSNPLQEIVNVALPRVNWPVEIYFADFKGDEKFKECFDCEIPEDTKGLTCFSENNPIVIYLDAMQTLQQQMDILAHELAHVLTELEKIPGNEIIDKGVPTKVCDEHSAEWGINYKWIYDEYSKTAEKVEKEGLAT